MIASAHDAEVGERGRAFGRADGSGGVGACSAPGASHAWMWPVGVMVLLFGSVAIVVGTAVIASSDPSVAMEPDYYERAAAWDTSAAQRDASARLGWRVGAEVSESSGPLGERTLRVTLVDSQGAPVVADRVEVEAFHHARSRDRVALSVGAGQAAPERGRGSIVLAEPGAWSWSLGPSARGGLWQVRVRAMRGEDVFVATVDVESARNVLVPDASAAGGR